MTLNPANIFDFMRPNLTTKQVQALYRLLESGSKLEDIALFAGMTFDEKTQSNDSVAVNSKFSLSQKSLDKLVGVNPNLVKVVKRAIEITDIDFTVIEGVRSKEQAYINWGKGRTVAQLQAKGVPTKYAQPNLAKVTWLNNPLGSKHMDGSAVDLVPVPIDWNDLKRFDQMASAMLRAASELGIKIKWGADWNGNGKYREKGETDSPHFELS